MAEIRIPQGMRDFIEEECIKKQTLQQTLENIFTSFGYKEIMTPMIEYYETYQQAFSTLEATQMYKFFDQEGDILTLHADMTVPVARVCATKYTNVTLPYRFFYTSDVFKVRQSFAGKRSQVTDCGIELIGLDEDSDVEVLYIAMQVMKSLQTETYTIEIGDANLFFLACESLQLSKQQTKILANYIDHKLIVDLHQFVDQLSLQENQKNFFLQLPFLSGKEEVLEKATQLCFLDSMKQEMYKLKTLYKKLEQLNIQQHISFDLGKIPHLDYYTGIIFEGFIQESGTSVLSGGRYDHLLKKFGRDLPACGFSVKLDYVFETIKIPHPKQIKIYYPKGQEVEAIQKANKYRKESNVSLIPTNDSTWRIEQ